MRGGGPHQRQGRQRCPDLFHRVGDGVRCLERSKDVGGGRGKLSGALEWGKAVVRGKEIEGEEGGGPAASQAVGGERLGHVKRKILAAWAAT
jgi:hypothetical protein